MRLHILLIFVDVGFRLPPHRGHSAGGKREMNLVVNFVSFFLSCGQWRRRHRGTGLTAGRICDAPLLKALRGGARCCRGRSSAIDRIPIALWTHVFPVFQLSATTNNITGRLHFATGCTTRLLQQRWHNRL